MKYILIAKCDICGKPKVYRGESKSNDILNIALSAGMSYLLEQDKMVCQDCCDEYYGVQQRYKTEIEAFFKQQKNVDDN